MNQETIDILYRDNQTRAIDSHSEEEQLYVYRKRESFAMTSSGDIDYYIEPHF